MTPRISDEPSLCIGCLACLVACMQQKNLAPGGSLIKVQVVEKPDPPYDLLCNITYCRHCPNPPCLAACPSLAIEQALDGRVTFLLESCTACGACVEACPYDAIRVSPESGKASICDLCWTSGEPRPACLRHCPSGALSLLGVPQ